MHGKKDGVSIVLTESNAWKETWCLHSTHWIKCMERKMVFIAHLGGKMISILYIGSNAWKERWTPQHTLGKICEKNVVLHIKHRVKDMKGLVVSISVYWVRHITWKMVSIHISRGQIRQWKYGLQWKMVYTEHLEWNAWKERWSATPIAYIKIELIRICEMRAVYLWQIETDAWQFEDYCFALGSLQHKINVKYVNLYIRNFGLGSKNMRVLRDHTNLSRSLCYSLADEKTLQYWLSISL